jgi:hypothetical protein
LEQSAHGLFLAVLDGAGVEAPAGAPLSSSVDAAGCASIATACPVIAGSTTPRLRKQQARKDFDEFKFDGEL